MSYGKYASQWAYGAVSRWNRDPALREAVYNGATELYQRGRSLSRSASSYGRREAKVQARSARLGALGGRSTGYYRGRFPKPRRSHGVVDRMVAKYSSKGYTSCAEIYGTASDPDCVYVGHSTYQTDQMAIAIVGALLRSLLKKAGFDPDTPDQEIPFNSYNDSSGFELRYNTIDTDGATTANVYAIPNNTTLQTLIGNSGLFGLVAGRMNKDDGFSRYDLERIALYSLDGTTGRLAAEINVQREHVELEVTSTLVVQNRTKPATGSSTSTDVVDNQPLKGILYGIHNGMPTLATMGSDGLDGMNQNGVLLQQASDLSPAQYFKEPPPPKLFTNCKKWVHVELEPGSMKRTSLHFRVSGTFNTVIQQKLTNQSSTVGPPVNLKRAPGKCELFALEERLETGSLNLITVAYECEKRFCARTWQGRKASMLPFFSQTVLNNN